MDIRCSPLYFDGYRRQLSLVDAILSGKILVIDELDAKLHPFLTRKIILLFMDSKINRNGAQLIFATHDTNLLNLQYMRRDQIWFTEKNKTDSTELYSLVEFRDDAGNKVRNDRNIEKDYINGRYGAIPFMSWEYETAPKIKNRATQNSG